MCLPSGVEFRDLLLLSVASLKSLNKKNLKINQALLLHSLGPLVSVFCFSSKICLIYRSLDLGGENCVKITLKWLFVEFLKQGTKMNLKSLSQSEINILLLSF